ncbi:hypothetical protein HKD37_15G043741 [Glycine soja]
MAASMKAQTSTLSRMDRKSSESITKTKKQNQPNQCRAGSEDSLVELLQNLADMDITFQGMILIKVLLVLSLSLFKEARNGVGHSFDQSTILVNPRFRTLLDGSIALLDFLFVTFVESVMLLRTD